jgi:hypothetical protein
MICVGHPLQRTAQLAFLGMIKTKSKQCGYVGSGELLVSTDNNLSLLLAPSTYHQQFHHTFNIYIYLSKARERGPGSRR